MQSLDERFIEFNRVAAPAFGAFPQMEPLRYQVFRELFVLGQVDGLKGLVKHWARPLVRRRKTSCLLDRCDVVLWLSTRREVVSEALIPLHRELVERDVDARVVVFGGPEDLPFPSTEFFYRARSTTPKWAPRAWELLLDLVRGLDGPGRRASFLHACAMTAAERDEIERLLDRLKPRAVVTAGTQFGGCTNLGLAARARGIRSVVLQHGMLQAFYTPFTGDTMVTWGELHSSKLVKLGVPEDKSIALGSPRHDGMRPGRNGDARARLRKALNLPDLPVLMFYSSGNDLVRNGDGPRECASWLGAAAERLDGKVTIAVRLHANENGELYWGSKCRVHRPPAVDLSTSIEGSDWIGSICSTVLYEALLYRKTVLQFDSEMWPQLADNWRDGMAERIDTKETLLRKILGLGESSPSPFDGALETVFVNHGRAAAAVADHIAGSLR